MMPFWWTWWRPGARLVGLEWNEIPYLAVAVRRGHIDEDAIARVNGEVPVLRAFRRAPPRSRLAVVAEDPRLAWLKKLVRPLLTEGPLLELAYRFQVVQDVYNLKNDAVEQAAISEDDERRHRSLLQEVCPMGWDAVFAGAGRAGDERLVFDSPECVQCLNCYWGLPVGAIRLRGEMGQLEQQVAKFKTTVEKLFITTEHEPG